MRNTRNSKNNNGSASLEIFTTWSDKLEKRLDPFFYRPYFEELEKKLKSSNYPAKSLKDIADFIAGYAFSSNDYSDDGIPLIRIQDITDNGVNFETEKYLPFNYLDKFSRFKIRKRDILISMTGALKGDGRVGKIALNDQDANALLNQRCGIIRSTSKEVLQNYLYAFLNTELFRELLVKHSAISVQVNASETDINSIFVPIPPLSVQNEVVKKIQEAYEQKKKKETEILKILSSIDDFVLGELGIDMPRGGAERVFQIWSDETLGNRMDAEYYNPVYKLFYKALSSGKYEIAEINNVATAVFQGVGKNETENSAYTLLKVKNIKKNNEIEFEDVEFVKEVPENKVLKVGDIISPFIGEAVRQCKFSVFGKEDGKFAVDNNTGVIRIDNKKVNSEYVAYILNSKIGRVQLKHLIGGGGVPFLGAGNAKKLKIPLPPVMTQNKIVDKIGAIYAKAKRLHQEAESIVAGAEKQIEQMILA